jgi:tricorn protease
MRRLIQVAVLIALAVSISDSKELLLQKPTVSAAQIVFSYGRDLWIVPREGGDAKRLTSGVGVKTNPHFSPDGSQIAFTGDYDGGNDVFVMPASGGVPRRLTYHPRSDWVTGWTPDGARVLFFSSRTSATPGAKLFSISLDGGFPTEIPLPIAEEGSYSPDARKLAYVPFQQFQPAWKQYRGGATAKIRIADLRDSSVLELPRKNSNDFNPMWIGDKVFFLSDRNGPVRLFSYDTRTRQVEQVVQNGGPDFKSASAGPGAIVYEQFGSLHLFDLSTRKTTRVEVRIVGDLPDVRPHFINVAKRLRSADISPNGARAIFEARGEIVTVPAEKGGPRNLTNSPGVRESEPAWSPDGKTVVYLSDESGEYELHLRDPGGAGAVKKIKLGEKLAFYYGLRWSPDSKKIAFIDNHLGIWYVDLDSKRPVLIDTDYYLSEHERIPTWSPDSKWLAYRKQVKSHLSAIYIYSLAKAASSQVTDGTSDVRHPVFDRNGRYLYFTASTDAGPSLQPDVLSRTFPVTRSIYLVVLSGKQGSPLAPQSDEEDSSQSRDQETKDAATAKTPESEVEIDLERIQHRILALPMPARRYEALEAGAAGILYAVEAPVAPSGTHAGWTVHCFNLAKRQSDVVFENVYNFRPSFNGRKMLYQRGDQWVIEPASSSGTAEGGKARKVLNTEDLGIRVEPRAEWKQMYHEVWRLVRDFFYDPNYHGLDLRALEKRYEPLLEDLASRQDLNYLFTEMLGELRVSHVTVGGGDTPETKKVQVGLLGADYTVANGRYRFTRIYDGESWNPSAQAPLSQPGANVVPGEYLLAVNGREVEGTHSIYSFFEGTVGKTVLLKVGPSPSGANARSVVTVPIADEGVLRYVAWVEANRRLVGRMTNDRVAYIHLPDTSAGGYTSFVRYFFMQVGKEAAIIDDRFNQGGHLATDIIEYLQRSLMSVATLRDGAEVTQPQGAIFGPKVMITNELAGSGGDAIAWYFKRFGVGKLIGMPTWGGVVGNTGTPALMDDGVVTVPGAWTRNPNGAWEVENQGVMPDIEVDLDPRAMREGHDSQLEKAVAVVMAELEKHPVPRPKPPAYHK